MKYSLILEGGGVQGIAHTGAIACLSEFGIFESIMHVSGTSSGALVAALVASRFSSEELKQIMFATPFKKIKDSSIGCFRDMFRLYKNYGYHKGTYIESYLNKILEGKFGISRITFKDLFIKTGVHLKLTGTCVSDRKLVWFDYILTPSMEVAKAVQISACIPYFFAPVKYDNKYYVDGGCLRNIPIDAFEDTTPIILDLVSISDTSRINNVLSFTSAMVETLLFNIQTPVDLNGIRIEIPTGTISAINFNVSDNDKKFLFYSGYNTVKNSGINPILKS
jgi:predicted acylesterase/phospholipase RssA